MLAALLVSLNGATAGPAAEPSKPISILPQNVGIGVPTDGAVDLEFGVAVDRTSVMESLTLSPDIGWRVTWADDSRSASLAPGNRWLTDARYVVRVGADALRSDGEPLGRNLKWSFTTETAPVISDFQLYYADEEPADRTRARTEAEADAAAAPSTTSRVTSSTASGVSAATRVTLGFSTAMDRADVEQRFSIHPFVPGTFTWEGDALVFQPDERLESGARYAVSVIGARDARGNRLAGDVSFSFTVRPGAQVVKVRPKGGETDVETDHVQVWFTQPMDVDATGSAFSLVDTTADRAVPGSVSWNTAGTQLTFKPSAALAKGHHFSIEVGDGARDMDRNAVSASFSFATKAPPPPPAPRRTTTTRPAGPPAPSDILQYALWQINQARAAYGFAPLVLDATITQEATAYAWDMLNYNYFSHVGRDGSHVSDRLRRAGVSFGWSGENICYLGDGSGVKATLNWCHSVFMSEPYPGYANHIGNILSPNYTRVGIGIAQSGIKIKIVWDFAG